MDLHAIHLAPGTEQPRATPPWVSFLLAYAAMVPFVVFAAAAWLVGGIWLFLAIRCGVAWAGGLLCFFAGVHRGLSFRQPGGPTLPQLTSMMFLFGLGMLALLSPWPGPSLVLCLFGYAGMYVLDLDAARHAEAPRYFARLRPVQLLFPLASLAALLARVLVHTP